MKSGKTKKNILILTAILSCACIILTGCGADIDIGETFLPSITAPAITDTAQKTSAASSAAADASSQTRVLCGSFIQPWLAAEWTQERWVAECRNMAGAGMKYIIIQSLVDLNYNTDTEFGQDPDLYTLEEADSLYPSLLPELKSANNGSDSLEKCLEACKKTGIKAVIGLVSDNRWWLYGWGLPDMPAGASGYATESYFAKFIYKNADISNRIACEVWQRYGAEYKDQLYGWYYNNEIWNIDAACEGTDKGVYAELLSRSMNLYLSCFSRITPGMPMMLSPFINPELSTPEECEKMWEDIFARTEFRKGDIFCPQDSFGWHIDLDLDKWWAVYRKAAGSKPGLVLWANNENYRGEKGVARVDDFVKRQINVTAKYAEANVAFSWNHYYSPLESDPGYNESYIYYVKNGRLESEAPERPVLSAKGMAIVWNSSDNIGIYGFRVCYGSKSNLIAKVETGRDETSTLPRTYNVEKPGTYYISVYDFSGNESEQTEIILPPNSPRE